MNKLIITTYKLEALDPTGNVVTTEEATESHPFKFISGMGFALDAFEQHVEPLAEGDTFDFMLEPEEAYGPYDKTHVVDFPLESFCIDGRFDSKQIYPGANVPLINEDGQRFIGHVLEVNEEKVRIDLNDTLAGRRIHFTGRVVVSRPATNEEFQAFVNLLSGEECGCGCGCDHEHKHDGHECCGHHHHDGQCCGKHKE